MTFDPDLPLPVGNFLRPAEGVIEMHPSECQGLGASRPTRTIVPVPELHYGYLVEVDAIAVIAKNPAATQTAKPVNMTVKEREK